MMRFHGYWRSSAAWRCRIAFHLKGVEPDYVFHHLTRDGGEQHKREYRSLNPQALVPSLEVNSDILTQSMAIIEWLDEIYPDPELLPGNAIQRAKIRGFAQVIACDIHPLQNLRVLQFLRGHFHQNEEHIKMWLSRWLGDGLSACEALLNDQEVDKGFAFGPVATLADVCLAPQIFSAHRFGVDINRMPKIKKLEETYASHPAFIAAQPDQQLDSEA